MSQLACKYGLQLADLQTIREVETNGSGFLPDGRPKILFERHWFRKFTGGIYDSIAPNLSGPWDKGAYRGGAGEWARFDKAQKMHREAAIMSTSWGAGQIMGFHFKALGFATAQDFLNENFKGEAEQIEILLKFLFRNPAIYAALKARRWADFARLYNGPKYAENKYDIKLAASFKKFSGQTA